MQMSVILAPSSRIKPEISTLYRRQGTQAHSVAASARPVALAPRSPVGTRPDRRQGPDGLAAVCHSCSASRPPVPRVFTWPRAARFRKRGCGGWRCTDGRPLHRNNVGVVLCQFVFKKKSRTKCRPFVRYADDHVFGHNFAVTGELKCAGMFAFFDSRIYFIFFTN